MADRVRTRWGRRWPNFTPKELGGRAAESLLDALERLRAGRGGRPLQIISGYRSPEHNAAVGGATDSQHLHARAADIPAGYATVGEAEAAGFTGIGNRGPWAVHVDTRPGPPARWSY